MKKTILCMLVFVLLFAGCRKKDTHASGQAGSGVDTSAFEPGTESAEEPAPEPMEIEEETEVELEPGQETTGF